MKRRQFIQLTGWAAIGIVFLKSCGNKAVRLLFKITGTNHILGHRLWTKDFPKPTISEKQKIVIVGSGISALSAARALTKAGETDFVLFELESQIGGNAASKKNQNSAYPTGAHYVPAINLHHLELVDFFEEEQIITGYTNGKAIYHPEYCCHTPQERLFFEYQWIEGIEPGLIDDTEYHTQMERFTQHMEVLRYEKGSDGLFAFDLPIAYSSKDEVYRDLDKLSMHEWLKRENYTHSHVLWYINYCCLDDFGRDAENVSAWAGIHYFTSRKYKLYSRYQEVLTWPEGNGFLVNRLKKYTKGKVYSSHLVYDLKIESNEVVISVFDEEKNQSKTIHAEKVILATPQYINQYLLSRKTIEMDKFNYSPWIVATIVIERFPASEGAPLSWENIIFQGKGLGYVYNQHQNLSHLESPFVITYYRALDGKDLKENRKKLLKNSDDYWKEEIISDIKSAHPEIEQYILSIELFKRGHGMISPSVDFIFSDAIWDAAKPIDNKIFFAHTDLSGISLFEEAFYQGTKVVNELLKNE